MPETTLIPLYYIARDLFGSIDQFGGIISPPFCPPREGLINVVSYLKICCFFPPDEKLTEIGINTHIMPLMYVLLDAIVSATPRRLLHAYQPALYMLAYTLFNLTYYLCGGLVGIVSIVSICRVSSPASLSLCVIVNSCCGGLVDMQRNNFFSLFCLLFRNP